MFSLGALQNRAPDQSHSAEQAKKVFTLEQAVDFDSQELSGVRASWKGAAAESRCSLARENYLATRDMVWQANRRPTTTSRMLLPQSSRPISGPVRSQHE